MRPGIGLLLVSLVVVACFTVGWFWSWFPAVGVAAGLSYMIGRLVREAGE